MLTLRCDVTEEAQVEEAFAETVSQLGRVDACFANAGIPPRFVPITELTLDEWRRMIQVHLEGAFLTLRTAMRHMIERGEGGALIATSSLAALNGASRAHHYAAAKAGILAMIKGLAAEGGRHGIRANAIVPGWIDTAFAGGMLQSEPFQKVVLGRIPLRRWGQGKDSRAIAIYLASEDSAYHTGDAFVIDGGYSCF